jgi:hypothetical protein
MVLIITDNQPVDMAILLSNISNNFETSDIDSINLLSGDHILSNLSISDFEEMVSDSVSNELMINGDNGDKIKLDLSIWDKNTLDTDLNATNDIADDGFITYTATSSSLETLTLLIEKDIIVENI